MAGFRGCRGFGAATPLTNTLNTPTGFLYNFAQGVWASRYSSSAWSPALDTALTTRVPAPTPSGDVLTIRRALGPGWALTAEMASATAALGVSSTGLIRQGDLLMVSDCGGAAVLQATNATPGADGSIEHSSAVTLTPGVSTGSLGRPFLQDALVHRLATSTYYIAASARTGKTSQRALWVYTTPSYDGTTYPQELVTGVERLAVRLGIDSNGDGGVESYVLPNQVTDWSRVTAVQIDLLLASTEDFVTTASQSYMWDGASITPPDRRQRTVVSLTASVRNATR
jgi:type IV pilus assembly protein PilW